MKRKAILASAMALALMASPFGGMNVSAEEGENISALAVGSTASSSGFIAAPTNARFSDNYYCTIDWDGTGNKSLTSGPVSWHVEVYRDDTLIRDYNSLRDNSSPWYLNCQTTGTLSFPLYQDMEESGTYWFRIRAEKPVPQNWGVENSLAVSEWVTSEKAEYARPGQSLGTTAGYWDAEREGVFHFTSVEGAAGYEFRLYKWDDSNSQWKSCILMTTNDGTYTSIGHLSAFSRITPDSPRDAGGEDITRDFTNDIFGNNYNAADGRYAVTVKALSGNLNETANGAEGEMSAALEIGGNSGSAEDSGTTQPDDTSSQPGGDSSQSSDSSTLDELLEAARPGEVISMRGVTTLSNSEMKQLLEHKVTLEMSYTYEGVDYNIRIPAGSAMNNDIPWYGPLYLAQYYSVNGSNKTAGAAGPSYTVQSGDTLGKIARANNMTLAELAAKNPQIKNVNLIMPGQAIQIK